MQREKQEAKSQKYMLDKSQDEICLQIHIFLRTKNKIFLFKGDISPSHRICIHISLNKHILESCQK